MHAFVIADLMADCTYGYRVCLNLTDPRIFSNAITSNLAVYSPEDEEFPQNKIMNLIDGQREEGWLNFYFMRFSNDVCFVFCFGRNNGVEISNKAYIGNFQAYPDVLSKLTARLNQSVGESADEFRRLYTAKNTEGIKKLVENIIHSIKQ